MLEGSNSDVQMEVRHFDKDLLAKNDADVCNLDNFGSTKFRRLAQNYEIALLIVMKKLFSEMSAEHQILANELKELFWSS